MHNMSITLTGQKVITGGSRQPVTKRMVEQPWKTLQPHHGTACPFCSSDQGGKLDTLAANGEVIEWHQGREDYRMVSLTNIFTPNLYHELLVPRSADRWPGNTSQLAEVLKIIFRIHRERVFPTANITNAQFGFHYGQCAAQNVPHPHWHIVGSDWPQQDICPWCDWRQKQDCMFLENGSLVALLDGVRAGETVIVSRDHNWKWEGTEGEIAAMLDQVVQLFRERFNDPDFILSTALKPNGHFWLSYTPILNQGGCDWVLAIRGIGAFAHPCAPEAMQSYLRTGQR